MSKRSKSTRSHTLGAPVHGAGVIQERDHDAYRLDHKPAHPTVCPQCHVVHHAGLWQRVAPPAGAQEALCPACRRIRDRFPAGYVSIEGEYFREHRAELMRLVEHCAERAGAEHVLQRIMATEETADGVLVTTTDLHLARGIAQALHHAHQGELTLRYQEAQTLLRAHWKR
jgi:NMD protein affecting ribosome stability and mRNA decay